MAFVRGTRLPRQQNQGLIRTPNEIPGLVSWWDVSDSSTVTVTGSGVSTLADKSSVGNDMTQGTDAARPAVQSAAINGLDVARFDGTDDFLRAGDNTISDLGITTSQAGSDWSICAVVEIISIGLTSAEPFDVDCLINDGLSTGLDGGYMGLSVDSTGPQLRTWTYMGATKEAATSISTGTPILIAASHSGLIQRAVVNGTPSESSGGTAGLELDTSELNIGRDWDQNAFANFDLGELVVYNRALNSDEANQVLRYLDRKWGIGIGT